MAKRGPFDVPDTYRGLQAMFQREQLHSAAQDGDLAKVEKLLLAKYPVNRFDSLGKTPLHYAVAKEHFDVVEALIRAGANVNAHDERVIGDTPLGDCAKSGSFEMIRRLLDAGADPTIPGWMQLTAIHRDEDRKDANAKTILRLLQDAAKRRK
jgi:ankyrin repeat protein